MPCEGGIVSQDAVVADDAIVGNMDIGHHPVVVPKTGQAAALGGAEVKGAEFADGVAIANFESGGLASVFFILWRCPQRDELENPVVATNGGVAFNHGMGSDRGTGTNANVLTNHGIGADGDAGVDLRPFGDDGGRVNRHLKSPDVRTSNRLRRRFRHRPVPQHGICRCRVKPAAFRLPKSTGRQE